MTYGSCTCRTFRTRLSSPVYPSVPAQHSRTLIPVSPPKIVVVGAGAFGGWTALELLRRGAQVTLVDAWGPGNTRAELGRRDPRDSGDVWQPGDLHANGDPGARALARVRPHLPDRVAGMTGVLWMLRRDDAFAAASVAAFRAERHPIDVLSVAAARRRYPQINFDGSRRCSLSLRPATCSLVVRADTSPPGWSPREARMSPVR